MKNSNQAVITFRWLCVISLISTIVLSLLKVSNVITWSWLWVTSPLWIYVGLGLAFKFLVWIASVVTYYIERDE